MHLTRGEIQYQRGVTFWPTLKQIILILMHDWYMNLVFLMTGMS